MRPPISLNYPKHVLFRIQKPLYGIPEAGVHWFTTYHRYHRNRLHMTSSPFEMCFMFTKAAFQHDASHDSHPRGSVCLQTDDTAYLGNEAFIVKEGRRRTQFQSKEKEILSEDTPIKFYGGTLSKKDLSIYLSQPEHCKNSKLSTIKTSILKSLYPNAHEAHISQPFVGLMLPLNSIQHRRCAFLPPKT